MLHSVHQLNANFLHQFAAGQIVGLFEHCHWKPLTIVAEKRDETEPKQYIFGSANQSNELNFRVQ